MWGRRAGKWGFLPIKDKSVLYLAYMPFVKNGGLFILTSSYYRLGDEVFMLLNLMGVDEKLPVAGRVIWMTPKGAQGKRTAGIGVQFSGQDRGMTRRKIESYLAGALGGDKPIYIMWILYPELAGIDGYPGSDAPEAERIAIHFVTRSNRAH